MNPQLSKISEENDVYRFTISDLNVCFANAIRRTILSDIPITVIETDTYDKNKCTVHKNTGRLHNEILKHRLSCIPIHEKDLERLPNKYTLELEIKNETENIFYVTSEHFKIKNKETGAFLSKEETKRIFPPNSYTGYYIDFARLRPQLCDTIPGEELAFSAEFSISNAKDNSMYNVVSRCSFGNTVDVTRVNAEWENREEKLRADGETKESIDFQKKNFMLLDAQRIFVENSFDFVIQTVGIYSNQELVKKACLILQNRLIDIIEAIDANQLSVLNSETTIENCFDVILEKEDYTLGKIVEYLIYEKYYVGEKTLSFCGFKKFHPHNDDSTLRLAFEQKSDKTIVMQYVRTVCVDAQELFKKMYSMW